MDVPVNFKFDVRIRTRHLAKGVVTEAEVAKHLDALVDAQPQVDVIDLAQPALTSPEERQAAAAAIRPSAVVARPSAPLAERVAPLSIPPAATPVDAGWGGEEDEDDEDDEDDEEKPAEDAAEPKDGGA